MKSPKIAWLGASMVVVVLTVGVLASTGGLASAVEMSRRWFDLEGSDGAQVFAETGEEVQTMTVEAEVTDDGSGVSVVSSEVSQTSAAMTATLAEIEASVRAGELTATRETVELDGSAVDTYTFVDSDSRLVAFCHVDPETGRVLDVSLQTPPAPVDPESIGQAVTVQVEVGDDGTMRVEAVTP
ncbi:MAG: hypothetical protein GF320_11690 [Armatimonadia bacterium]|nr:hypothetical protein [Armatimonadia bacterium]